MPVIVLYTAVTLFALFLDEGRLLTVSRVDRVQGKLPNVKFKMNTRLRCVTHRCTLQLERLKCLHGRILRLKMLYATCFNTIIVDAIMSLITLRIVLT